MANDAVERAMKPIPIEAAKRIADEYGYDQVIVFARRVGEKPNPHGEHLTTYGVNKTHCGVAARVGNFLKTKVMGWYADDVGRDADRWNYVEDGKFPNECEWVLTTLDTGDANKEFDVKEALYQSHGVFANTGGFPVIAWKSKPAPAPKR